MKVFIIGGTGLLGFHATLELLKRGHEVSTVSLPPLPPEGLFPSEVKISLGNLNDLKDDELLKLMSGHDALVFAAGIDDRYTPDSPALEFFRKANVEPTARVIGLCKEAGIKRAVVLGSYFSYFAKIWPEMKIRDKHPYIKSRLEQEEQALKVGGNSVDVMILELPYIFGVMPSKKPLWTFLIDYINSSKTVYFPKGGTTMVTVKQVGEAIAGALENGKGGQCYPIGGVNMPWTEFLGKILNTLGQNNSEGTSSLDLMFNKKVVTIPTFIAKIGGLVTLIRHRRAGKESGLHPISFMDLQASETYIDPYIGMKALGYKPDNIDEAIKITILECMKQ